MLGNSGVGEDRLIGMHLVRPSRFWLRTVVVLIGSSMVVAACGRNDDVRESAGEEPRECEAEEGSVIDVAHEPDWRQYGDHLPWTDRDGCLLRIDVLAERPGPDHCGWGHARVVITGQPLGAPYTTPADTTEFVRDPEGVFGRPDIAAGFDPDAVLPDDAVDSGYRRDDLALWHVPGDASAVWLVSRDGVERWPAGHTPLCS
jgi:hypothetical protein